MTEDSIADITAAPERDLPTGARLSQSGRRSEMVFVDAGNIGSLALADLWLGLKRPDIWWNYALMEIKLRFRRSVLGPFWLTLSMGIMVGALGFVFSSLFKQDVAEFLPYLATGLILWGIFSTIVTEGCSAFIVAEGYIRNTPMPLSSHYYRMLARNVIIWAHNMVIYLLVFLIFQRSLSLEYLLFLPGAFLFFTAAGLIGLIASIFSTRFRDIPQVVASLVQVIFFVTPVFWSVDAFPGRPRVVLWNPLYHLIEIARAPLLGRAPEPISWIVAIALIAILTPTALLLYRRAYGRIPYWV